MARRDGAGGLWFSQSAHNSPAKGEEELWGSVASAAAHGAVLYLAPGGAPDAAVVAVDGLVFANGMALDEARGFLYLAETVGGRILRYRMDVATGTLTEPAVLLEGLAPDNIELDAAGRLWIALPLRSEIITLDPESGAQRSMFRVATPETEASLAAITARMTEGKPWLDLMTPALWSPAPGAVTGMVLSSAGELRYVTGLGDALIRIDAATSTTPPSP
jgi:sugar lactone lactonase YvrE